MKTPILLVLFSLSSAHANFECPQPAKDVLKNSTRLLAVRTATWNEKKGTMRVWERSSPAAPWVSTATPEPIVLGRKGLAWGHLYRDLATGAAPKKEGDGRTPAGVHAIGPRFGFDPAPAPDYIPLKATTFCVDDPASTHYNRIVDSTQVRKDWNSAEDMSRIAVYRLGLEVKYESSSSEKAGSCIFLHLWTSPEAGTAGCVAMAEPLMTSLQKIKPQENAALAILPATEWTRWRACFPGLK